MESSVLLPCNKAMDNSSQVVNYIGQAGLKQDFYRHKCDKSVSAQNSPGRLVTSAVHELPVGKGRHFLSSMPSGLDDVFGAFEQQTTARTPRVAELSKIG